MTDDFNSFADEFLVALADEAEASDRYSASDLRELCEKRGIAFKERWLSELPRYLTERGLVTEESTLKSRRVRIRGAGLEQAIELRRAKMAEAVEGAAITSMPMTATTRRHAAADRFDFLFGEASRELPQRLKALYMRHSAKGHLQSGVTIRRAAERVEGVAVLAINSALDAVTLVTSKPGRKRSEILDDLTRRTQEFIAGSEAYIAADLRKFSLDPKLLTPLMNDVNHRRGEQIEQYRGGWTAPPARTWKERHPTLHDILVAGLGACVGALVALLGS